MNCGACREVLTAFFEQTLTEPLRFETCEHLSECPDCLRRAEESGQWEVEFLKLNHLTAPDDWMKHWQDAAGYSERIRIRANKPSKNPHPSEAWKFWVSGACLFLASTFIVFKYLPQKYTQVSQVEKHKPPPELEPEALRELREIAVRLGIKLDPAGKAVYVPGKVIAPGVELKPLHEHLMFSSEEDVVKFEKWVFSLKPDASFKTSSLWILTLNRGQLLTLMEGVKNWKVKTEGSFSALSPVPIFGGQVRVSLYIDRTFQPGEALLLYQHWHFTFALTNRLDLFERLKSSGVKMLYESPELWVFETAASNLKEVMEVVGQCGGLKADNVNLERLPDSGKIPIRISVYLSGR